MGPINKIKPASNNYTAMLALATGIVIASAIFITVKCIAFYGTVFRIMEPPQF